MGASRRGIDIHGILLLDKAPGRSSNHALQDIKRLFTARKAGHTGNLDPFATGMLPLCFGEATKTAGFMLAADKTSRATAVLGVQTSTGDIEGETVREMPVGELARADIEAAMRGFSGEIEQVPPMYSALKHKGEPLYKLAREGKEVERAPRPVTIHELNLEDWNSPKLTFEVRCSKGTYVRTLAEDLGEALGTCAHLEALRRLSVSPFDPSGMVTADAVAEAVEADRHMELLLPIDAGLGHWPKIEITEGQAARFSNGNPVLVDGVEDGMLRVYAQDGPILGIGESKADRQVHPKRLFLI
jgi:tRNA pseudouridine55 synthase